MSSPSKAVQASVNGTSVAAEDSARLRHGSSRRNDSPAPRAQPQTKDQDTSKEQSQSEDLKPSVPAKPEPEYWKIPLSDYVLDMNTANKLISSAQTREKLLKVLQYIVKFVVYTYQFWYINLAMAKSTNNIAKNISKARRFFKFFRWIKHFEDVPDAKAEKAFTWMWFLMWSSITCNICADVSEDICSLQRLNFLPSGTLPPWADLYANQFQLVLACVEIILAWYKAVRETGKSHKEPGSIEPFRKMRMAQLEFTKFLADLGKAFWDCELWFSSELLFILCGFYAACVSTHKFLLRALKMSGPPPKPKR